MKNTLIMLSVFIAGFAMGQKKKSTKTPPPFISPKIVVLKKHTLEIKDPESEKCFTYKTEIQKDGLTYSTENLLEYGWAADNARMVIITYNYDPVKKAEVEKSGYIYSVPQSMQFIDGDFVIEKDNLIFTPSKSNKFEKRFFKLIYKSKTKKIDHLEDEKKSFFKASDCLQPSVMMGS